MKIIVFMNINQQNINEITIDIMMIIGKYLENNQDYINIMKLNKKYKELVLMYKYNPISNISLFNNIS